MFTELFIVGYEVITYKIYKKHVMINVYFRLRFCITI